MRHLRLRANLSLSQCKFVIKRMHSHHQISHEGVRLVAQLERKRNNRAVKA